ncbi:MAG: 3-hydroxyacyl-CoA dehydrogenase family protein [Desulfosarcina sp.]|nr:3-hydroxyacyl-CoA dehydrogenase family protein [Desulfosarcina sp.]MBC2742097.1 3-hydroxyacyl-CoA dehydrogenase family protein [Desulfosarcina sp.]MBC2765010.1 3-hydroxyacyl-CoA dehydrogenase family protein [Desulfosarcina sp.]
MANIETVGIVGFGVMGAAIGLNAASSGYRVIYKELNDELVHSMYDRWVKGALEKRVTKGKMTQQEMDQVAGMISGTASYQDLAPCDLVIEAAVEKMDLKIQIFKDLDTVCRPDAIFVSNTSTFLIEKLMASVSNPSRTAGLHYFFPANINRLVEVIRQKETSAETFAALMAFAEKNRKVPIAVKDFPGFAINPVFISSYMMLDSFYGDGYNVATLEHISQLALGVRFGIMWVQNGSGLGTCYHAAVSMNDYLADTDVGYPAVPGQLKTQFESGKPWNLEDGPVTDDPALLNVVKERLLGSIFTISSHLVEKGVISMKDLELGICTSLAWPKGPFAMMNAMGMEESARLVALTVESGEFKMPKTFSGGVPSPWEL